MRRTAVKPWVRSVKASNDEDGYPEALLGIDEAGLVPAAGAGEPVFQTDEIEAADR